MKISEYYYSDSASHKEEGKPIQKIVTGKYTTSVANNVWISAAFPGTWLQDNHNKSDGNSID
jgi:hypothetical protein